MLKHCGLNSQSSAVRRFVVGVLCLVITAASLSDAIAHVGVDHDHQHSDKHHQESYTEATSHFADEAPENHVARANEPCMYGHDDAFDADQLPLNEDCEYGCEAHICLTAILNRNAALTAKPVGADGFKRKADAVLSRVNIDLFRPPIRFL